MNLSRSEGQRKLPSLSLVRWIVIIVGFVVFVLVSLVLYIRSADSDYRSSEKLAIRVAKEQAGLTEVTEVIRHTWDDTVWVATGKDAEDEVWMVWEHQSELVKRKVSENLSEQQMLAKFAVEHANATPIRIIPGWFQGQPAWEIRYWNDDNKQVQSLDFYSFQDGSVLKTYVLSSQ